MKFYVLSIGVLLILLNASSIVFAQDPDIEIYDPNGNVLNSGTGSNYYFGNIPINTTSNSEIFTIVNYGQANLNLTGAPLVYASGGDYQQFSFYTGMTVTNISPGIANATTFTITFNSSSLGFKSTTVYIESDDPDENPYTFTVTATGVNSCEIEITDPIGAGINSNDTYNFGNVNVGSPDKACFRILNVGAGGLVLTNNPHIVITGANEFTIVDQPMMTIPPGGYSDFVIQFTPTTNTLYTATLTIANDDADENPYVIYLEGQGVNNVPEINLLEGTSYIPTHYGVYDFGNVNVGSSSYVVFTIENLGSADLILNNNYSPLVETSGSNDFNITVFPSSPISSGNSSTFTLTFSPLIAYSQSGILIIRSNDSNESTYYIRLRGTGVGSEIYLHDSNGDIPIGGGYDFGNIELGSSSYYVTFTIENFGNASLTLTGSPIINITGADSSMFSANTVATANSISSMSSTTFELRFNPSSTGNFSASVEIDNNDYDEYHYTFTITGRCYITTFDFNGDTYDDIIVGFDDITVGGVSKSGVFIFLGKQNPTSPIDTSNSDVVLIGDQNINFGYCFSSAGDINNDGYDDVIVGAPDDGNNGSVFVYFGSHTPSYYTYSSVKIIGETNGIDFGSYLSNAGDVNGDSIDDIIIGDGWYHISGGDRNGCAYIFFGKSSFTTPLYASNADVRIIGTDDYQCFGSLVSYAGDINNDGIDDVIISAPDCDINGTDSGRVFIFFGDYNWSSFLYDYNADVIIYGNNNYDHLGHSICGAGDINDDGVDDIIIGAYLDDDGGSNSGCAFILFGIQNWNPSSPAQPRAASTADVTIVGEDVDDNFGYCVNGLGDVNNDGIDDIIIGAPNDDDNGTNSGIAYIFYGCSTWNSNIDCSTANLKLKGDNSYDYFGRVVCATDVNGDGVNDILVGSMEYLSQAYVFLGWTTNPSSPIYASNADIIISSNLGIWFIAGGI